MAETSPNTTNYPNLNPYAGINGSTSSPMDSLANGPVADKARQEAENTKTELNNLAAARTTPSTTAATGQKLTHYHSFFSELLSWNNPRATGIAYAAIVTFIFATRYIPLVRYFLKGSYIILGVTAAAEIAGRAAFGEGFATKMRPKKYYTVPRETLESIMEDLVELSNFFVIEFQRVVFAENVYVTIGAFLTALITYFLIKITPAWGLTLLFTTAAFFAPLIYIQNQKFIDEHLANASDLITQQAEQVRDLASQHTSKAMEASQSALKDYSAKASEMIGGAKQVAIEKTEQAKQMAAEKTEQAKQVTAEKTEQAKQVTAEKTEQAKQAAVDQGVISPETVKKDDFPAAPTSEPAAGSGLTFANGATAEEQKPLLA